jgi:hypothetical protein
VVPYEYIRGLLGFQKGAPELVAVPEGMCWRWISVNIEYLLYIGFDYDLQLTRH